MKRLFVPFLLALLVLNSCGDITLRNNHSLPSLRATYGLAVLVVDMFTKLYVHFVIRQDATVRTLSVQLPKQ